MLSEVVVHATLGLCQNGFTGVCIGRSIVSNRCFFVDLLVVDDGKIPTYTDPQHEVVEAPTTEAPDASSGTNTTSKGKKMRIHMAGDHVVSEVPKTVAGILEQCGATATTLARELLLRFMWGKMPHATSSVVHEDEPFVKAEGEDEGEDLLMRIQQVVASQAGENGGGGSRGNQRVQLVSLCFAASRESKQTLAAEAYEGNEPPLRAAASSSASSLPGSALSTDDYIDLVSRLFYTSNEVVEYLAQASTITGESREARLLRRRPTPRIGDVLVIPAGSVGLMPRIATDMSGQVKAEKALTPGEEAAALTPLGTKRAREMADVGVGDESCVPDAISRQPPAAYMHQGDVGHLPAFKVATVAGLMVVPQLRVTRPHITLLHRADPPRPADYADRWLLVRRVSDALRTWGLPSVEAVLPQQQTTAPLNHERKHATPPGGKKPPRKLPSVVQVPDNSNLPVPAGHSPLSQRDSVTVFAGRQGHAGRFKAFAEWIENTFSSNNHPPAHIRKPALRIADVAGGSGKLSAELSMHGHSCCIIDPRILDNEHIRKLQHHMRQRWLFRAQTKRHLDNISSNATTSTPSAAVAGGSVGGTKRDGAKATEEELFIELTIPTPTTIETLHCLCEYPRPTLNSVGCCLDREPTVPTGDVGGGGALACVLRGCDLIVGLHCDGAVNGILYAATANRRPFAIVPCCVFPSEFPRCLPPPPLHAAGDPLGDEDVLPSAASPPDGAEVGVVAVVPVITREQLLDWIEAEAAAIGYPGEVRRVTIPGLTGANVCVYGIPFSQ